MLADSDCNAASAAQGVTKLLSVYEKRRLQRLTSNLKNEYAAITEHAGSTYAAVQRLSENNNAECRIDRTSTVFSLLAQLYVSSQSADFLRGPSIGRLRVQ